MADFIDKKEHFADVLEAFTQDESKKEELISLMGELSSDEEFKTKDLFVNIFKELGNHLPELSKRELKQRVLMIRSYL